MTRSAFAAPIFSAALLLAILSAGLAEGGEIHLNGRTFHLADGFTLELAAAPPLAERPIVADFDEHGRLYVADSSGSNDPVAKQLQERPHRILRLEDTNGDGRFDRRTVFADRMMFPEGTMWFDGSLYVSAPPSIWKLTDTDGDGVADLRVEWFQGKTLTGCANDLHGPYLGPDGWIYWCKGAFASQTYARPSGPPLVTCASHIFRSRPDGTGLEPVMTGGMDNPVDVAFSPAGERFLTATFLQHPGGGQRDGLIHAVYGGVYGKVHDVLDSHPWTGPEVMPVLTHLGPAAPCGLTRYESDAFGPAYRDNLFAALFNLRKVTRHILQPDGSTFRTGDEDFLVSDDQDFHPTDVLEDADGSLLVVDTGGWYKLCCPTSQLGKPDVLGAIYRVRRTGARRLADPQGSALSWSKASLSDLAARLDDGRPCVRRRALEALARGKTAAVPVLANLLEKSPSEAARCRAVWALTRIDSPEAAATIRKALADPSESVRQAALHSVALRRDREAMPALRSLLQGPSAAHRRAAAEAIGRLRDLRAVPDLLRACEPRADRFLEHALCFALIEINDRQSTSEGLESASDQVRRIALTALDQMPVGGLTAHDLQPAFASADLTLRETAAWILGRHPEWAAELSEFLRKQLRDEAPGPARADLERQLARLSGSPAVQKLLADALGDRSASPAIRRSALRAIAQARRKDTPELWRESLAALIDERDEQLLPQALATVQSLNLSPENSGPLSKALLKVSATESLPLEIRIAALAAAPGAPRIPAGFFGRLLEALQPTQNVSTRAAAAAALAKAPLERGQLLELADALRSTGPLETNRLLDAFKASRDEAIGRRLVDALRGSPALATLRPETLRPLLANFGPKLKPEADSLLKTLNIDAEAQHVRLEGLLSSLSPGDIRRGQRVFNGTKGACSSCHAIGYLGGHVGPDLTRIGQIRSKRDLLESIVFPSASLVRSFEPLAVATREGKLYNGLVRHDTPDELVLAIGPDQEVRIARTEIEEVRPSTTSLMPAGLDQQLSPQEIADLIAFLKACR